MSETQESLKVTPQSLLSEELLRAALKADKGDDAEMLSYEVKDFTNKGDNYACVVTSGIVRYHQGDHKEKEVTYVAKCNPCRNNEYFEEFTGIMFTKEAQFYSKLLPLLNTELEATGQQPLRMATCYVTHLTKSKEVIVMNDLRADDFKMFDRKKGMDLAHITLVLRELARLHAASTLVQAKAPEPLEITYDFLQKDFDSIRLPTGEYILDVMMANNIETCGSMAKKIGGYDKVVDWLHRHSNQGKDMFIDCMKKSQPFDMLCHGDCWNNNILFKYDETGQPIDVRLIDLQICRKSSPATDLNYLMYTSLNGSVRKENLQAFLKTYYDAFGKVISAAGKTIPFTMEELKKEYHRQNLFGLLMAMFVVPVVVAEGAEIFDFNEMSGDMEKDIAEHNKKMIEQLDNNSLIRPRLLTTFDDMLEYGVIS